MEDYRGVHISKRSKHNDLDELSQGRPDATPMDGFPTICVHAKVCDREMNDYGPEEAAKLDAVLAGVNQLIECLNIEFDDNCCSDDHTAADESRKDTFCEGTSDLIGELKSSPTSESLPLNKTISMAGASKHHNLFATDNTMTRANCNKNEPESEFDESRAQTNENNNFFSEGDVILKNEIFNKILEGAEISSEMKSLKDKDKPAPWQEKQMTQPQLECSPDFNKEFPLSEQPFQAKEQLSTATDYPSVDFFINNNYSNKEDCSGETSKESKKIREPSNFNTYNDFDKSAKRKMFKKANSENSSAFFVRDSVDSGTFSIDIETLSITAPVGEDQEEAANKGKEKKKLKAVNSLPVKVASYKENQIAAIKALLPKRKISKGKEPPVELKKLQTPASDCSCFQIQDNGNRKHSSSFELPIPNAVNISNDKQSAKNQKHETRRKTFLPKQKKFGLYFRRSQSFDAKNSLEEVDSDCSSTTDDVLALDLDDKSHHKDFPIRENSKKNGKFRFSPSTPPASTETASKGTLDRMRLLMNKSSHISQHKVSNIGSRGDITLTKTSGSNEDFDSDRSVLARKTSCNKDLDQEDKVSSSCNKEIDFASDCCEFVSSEDGVHRRRATMDATPSRPNFLDTGPSTKFLSQGTDTNTMYSSLPRKWQQENGSICKNQSDTSPQQWLQNDSDCSFRGSQDSLDDDESPMRSVSFSRQRRPGRQYESLTEQNSLDSIAKLATMITKKNKLRKTLKKSTSVTNPDADEMAERTWAPTGDCTWGNMSGKRVELGSTRLQSLSELESDALQKVSLNHLHDAELGVTIIVPKDESKILNRKISLKKKYGVLSLKDKNKDKNYDHVFGIPLVNVVENDQLLRLQKSASFATPLDYQPQESTNDPTAATGAGAGSSLSSNTSSCSGSSSSIHTSQQIPQYNPPGENVQVPRPITKTASSENLCTSEYAANMDTAGADNVFSNMNGKENDNPNQAQTPTSAKSNSSSAAQPLRRRGAIAANSINEIDPYQSQLLEALSLSVSGATTSQRKEKKRSLLPPTMPSVPYVVQKCCDHIKKYGLDVTGIFRIAGSKKRVKQLREEFDGGMDVTIDEDYNPHDVAALLKEFFRDLPEALLTRELYPAFIQTAKLLKHERISCLRYLLWLLPLSNRDTLHTLLNFLTVVAAHSETSLDRSGCKVPGNKMNISNLAMIFGPNIMHRHKKTSQQSNDNHYQAPTLEKPEESTAVIKIVEDLITNQVQLFQVPKQEHDEMLRVLKETDPEAVDFLLRRKAANHMREKSRLLEIATPNSSKNFDQETENDKQYSTPDCTEPADYLHDQDDSSLSQGIPNNADDLGPRVYSAMRLSYQQATGHVLVSEGGGKQEKNTKLKFKRPIFKKVQQQSRPLADWSDIDERHSSSSGLEDIDETKDINVMEMNKDVDENSRDRCELAPSSMTSENTKNRSMSFTDDDLLQIIGRKDNVKRHPLVPVIYEFRCRDECCDNTNDQPAMQHAVEIKGEEFEYAQSTEHKVYFMKDTPVRITDLSDPDKSTAPASNVVTDVSVDRVRRRGGFSLQTQTKLESKEHDDVVSIDSDTLSPASTHLKAQRHGIERVDRLMLNDSNKNSLETHNDPVMRNGHNFASTHHGKNNIVEKNTKVRSRKFKSSLNVRVEISRVKNPNSNNNHNSDNPSSILHTKEQLLQLPPSTASAIHTVLSPDTQKESDSSNRLKYSVENDCAIEQMSSKKEEDRPKPLPRKRLQKSLSPRIQRQYGLSPIPSPINSLISERMATEDTSASLNQTSKDTDVESLQSKIVQQKNKQGVIVTMSRKRANRGFKTGLTRCDESNKVNSETNGSQSQKNNVASLVRRYSKDDLALAENSNQVSSSRWTSSGLLGKTDLSLNDSKQRSSQYLHKKENELQSTTNKGHLSWHAVVRDKQHLPETLV